MKRAQIYVFSVDRPSGIGGGVAHVFVKRSTDDALCGARRTPDRRPVREGKDEHCAACRVRLGIALEVVARRRELAAKAEGR